MAPQPLSEYSFGLLYFFVIHKHFLYQYQTKYMLNYETQFSWINPQCYIVFFNLIMEDLTLRPPLLVKSTLIVKNFENIHEENQTICFNKVFFYEEIVFEEIFLNTFLI